jgi:hypothetical protein
VELKELEKYEEIVDVSFDHEGAHLASTHTLQGGASNGWNTALILKADDVDQDLVKALEQVEVKLSMEEFLRKFFDMWSGDAELLTTILGMETEAEYRLRLQDEGMIAPDRMGTNESWEEFQRRNLESRADKVKFVEKANEDGIDSLSTVEKIAVLEFQAEIEKGVEFLGGFDAVIEKVKSESEKVDAGEGGGLSEEGKVVKSTASAEDKLEKDPSADEEINKNQNTIKGNSMTKKVEQTADQILLEKMEGQMADLEKALQDSKELAKAGADKLETLEKAEEARKLNGAQKLVKSFSFIAEDNQEAVVEFMVKSVDAPIIAEVLKQAQDAVTAAKADVEKTKAEFGETEHGAEGDTGKVLPEGQEAVNKSLESFGETLKNMAD